MRIPSTELQMYCILLIVALLFCMCHNPSNVKVLVVIDDTWVAVCELCLVAMATFSLQDELVSVSRNAVLTSVQKDVLVEPVSFTAFHNWKVSASILRTTFSFYLPINEHKRTGELRKLKERAK
jgi:hypothetical protein